MRNRIRFLSGFCIALLAPILLAQQPPVLSHFWPDAKVLYISEGQPLKYTAIFSDDQDPDPFRRGMSNVVWLVDSVPVLETTNGAPGEIMSKFVFCPEYSSVTNGGSRVFEIRVVGMDLQSDVTELACWVNVSNAVPSQTISFPSLPEKALGDADFSPGATASSGLPVSYTSSNEDVAQIVDGMVHLVGAGVTLIEASQAGNDDFRAARPVGVWLTVKVRLSAEVLGGGAVTGTGCYMPEAEVELTAVPAEGFYFQQWENGSHALSRRLVMPATNVQVSATFSTEVPAPEIGTVGLRHGMVGVEYAEAVTILSDCRPVIRVSGLPRDMFFNAASRTIQGVPRAACSNRLVTVTATNPQGVSASQGFLLTVDPLPGWVRGSFCGYVEAFADHTGGLASMRISENGKVSGKFRSGDTTLTFSADSLNFFTGYWEDSYISQPYYWLLLPLRDGATEWVLEVRIEQRDLSPWIEGAHPAVGYVKAFVLRCLGDGTLVSFGFCEMNQSASKGKPVATLLGERYAGYYTATLDGCAEYGSGYLALTVDKLGSVKAAGKLADGTAVSLSGQLVLDGNGRAWTPLLAVPASYKGGALFCVAEWVKPDDGPAFLKTLNRPANWMSRNPRATAEYGAGFSRSTGLTGGWYDKVGNLYDYYCGRTLLFASDSAAPNPLVQAGGATYESSWWRPDGLPIFAVLNSRGRMTGLAAPQPTPLLTSDDQLGSNPIQFSVSLNRATGLFRGSFNAWFNRWGEDETEVFSKRCTFGGVLTPERSDKGDNVEGRGYFLWGVRGQQEEGSAGSSYPVSESYDLRLLSQPEQ